MLITREVLRKGWSWVSLTLRRPHHQTITASLAPKRPGPKSSNPSGLTGVWSNIRCSQYAAEANSTVRKRHELHRQLERRDKASRREPAGPGVQPGGSWRAPVG